MAEKSRPEERILNGLGVSPGIAVGPAYVVEAGIGSVPEYQIGADLVEAEHERFAEAIAQSRKQVGKLRRKAAGLSGNVAEEMDYLLEAHQQMLAGSRLIRGVEARILEQRVNAEAAVQAEISHIGAEFAGVTDAYLAARLQDIRDVATRLVRNLMKAPYQAFSGLPAGTIVVAEELSPADIALMDPSRIGGLVTKLGGAEGHTAIMARALGLPAVLGIAEVGDLNSGDELIVDGRGGVVLVAPGKASIRRYERRRTEDLREQRTLARLRDLPALSRDRTEFRLEANIELPLEVETALKSGAEGIGLLRTEFMFMNREAAPNEDEQYWTLREVVEGMAGRPVTIRTLDVGGDKLAIALDKHIAHSANPALGLRAIRLSLRVPSLLETQLAAILRAGVHGPVRILLPMVTSPAEVHKVREVMKKVVRRLKRRGADLPDPLPPIGVMIEVPGAALAADGFARVADFFSIGTNDLTMYTLAIDRGNDQVAKLYDPLHPAVLRMIQFATAAALRDRLPVALCGEMAGDARYTALLAGLGLRELSMTPSNLLRVKQRVRALDLGEATRRTQTIMDQSDQGRIAAILDDFNALA